MYLVMGATGKVGRNIVDQLLVAGHKVRVFARDREKAAQWNGRVEVAAGEIAEPHSIAAALTGIERVFLMNGGAGENSIRNFVEAAKNKGCSRIVFLSSILASRPELAVGKLHRDQEEAIHASGLESAFLRATGFMSNAFQWIPTIKAEGVVYNAMGSGTYAPVAPEDIASVGVHALTTSDSSQSVFEITGGQLLNVPEQVNIVSDQVGKKIRCVDISTDVAVKNLVRIGLPEHMARAVAQSFEEVRNGRASRRTDTVTKITGREPVTFEMWVRKNLVHPLSS